MHNFNISYSKQIFVNRTTNTVHLKKSKNTQSHKVDFIVPAIKDNDNLKNYTIISCKTTLRERYLQDCIYNNCYIITLDSYKNIKHLITIKKNGLEFTRFLCNLIIKYHINLN